MAFVRREALITPRDALTYTGSYTPTIPRDAWEAEQQPSSGTLAKLRSSAVYIKHPAHPLIPDSPVTVGGTLYDKYNVTILEGGEFV